MRKPGTPAPPLNVEQVSGGSWRLADQRPEQFTMIVFYRGLHCPICAKYLQALREKLEAFRDRGVGVIAVSGDTWERAAEAVETWALNGLPVGYGQSVASMREWGLFVSHAIKDSEPALFGEPGLFLIRPDGAVYYQSVQSMPFGRPSWDEMLGAIDFVVKADYPPRGEA